MGLVLVSLLAALQRGLKVPLAIELVSLLAELCGLHVVHLHIRSAWCFKSNQSYYFAENVRHNGGASWEGRRQGARLKGRTTHALCVAHCIFGDIWGGGGTLQREEQISAARLKWCTKRIQILCSVQICAQKGGASYWLKRYK